MKICNVCLTEYKYPKEYFQRDSKKKDGLAVKCKICRAKQETIKIQKSLSKKTCLRCESYFISEGPHNRLCEKCRQSNQMALDTSTIYEQKSGPQLHLKIRGSNLK